MFSTQPSYQSPGQPLLFFSSNSTTYARKFNFTGLK
jgi:hypothetical protein